MKKTVLSALLLAAAPFANAADYVVDTDGAHASINFKISHLGYSYIVGRFNQFDGKFSYDAAAPEASKISINIDPASVDTNHDRRDKHVSSDDFLDVSKFTTASFSSTSVKDLGDGKLAVNGDLTVHGVTKPIVINVAKVGEGQDPWGGYRAGFTGSTEFKLGDFGIKMFPDSKITFDLHIEGVRQ
ncbi:YceI family protein [Bowmanella sp. JS7-9]|uniref:YceI family protein n=1 Tax=Pseudobowmanella zhangzhouensis TaxID=1537679 RepID=A0ABW1XK04_9ALTE|nr:YceI family protein [Bowmanella sp. JS7-9]TBX25672.1 hypothetical protein TK45_02945 [Bowmanella sp. JS7-9]